MTLDTQLIQLENSQLVRRLTEEELAYLFKHALVQDTAYSSLLKQDRKRLHRAVAETLERAYADRLDEYAARLAQHYAEAGDDAKTLEYATRAGDVAARVYANAEALTYYEQALELAKRDPRASEHQQKLYMQRGRVLELASDYEGALRNYQEMEIFGHAHHAPTLELAALIGRVTAYSIPSPVYNPPQAHADSHRALALARELNDRAAEAKILWNLMLLTFFSMADPHEAVRYGEESLQLVHEMNLHEQLAYTLNDLHMPYFAVGDMDRALTVLHESRPLWRELENLPLLSENFAGEGNVNFGLGAYDQTVALSQESYRISESIGNVWGQVTARLTVGEVYLERGEIAQAVEALSAAIAFGDQVKHLTGIVYLRTTLAWILGSIGATDRARELANIARAYAQANAPILTLYPTATLMRVLLVQGDLRAAETVAAEIRNSQRLDNLLFAQVHIDLAGIELALAQHDYTRALHAAAELLGSLQRTNKRPYRADALYLQAQAMLAQNQIDAAYESLCDARAAAQAVGSRRMLCRILGALSEMEMQRGDVPEAHQHREMARQIVEFIAAHTPPELRESFLNMPAVRRLSADS